jgi:hypothetical protein
MCRYHSSAQTGHSITNCACCYCRRCCFSAAIAAIAATAAADTAVSAALLLLFAIAVAMLVCCYVGLYAVKKAQVVSCCGSFSTHT